MAAVLHDVNLAAAYADDVVLLRDWRPLLNLTAFGARVGFNIFLGEAGA